MSDIDSSFKCSAIRVRKIGGFSAECQHPNSPCTEFIIWYKKRIVIARRLLQLELKAQSLEIEYYPQIPPVRIEYKGEPLEKKYEPDFLCYDGIIVEIKAMDRLYGNEYAQTINYLKASRLKIGLFINFGARSLEHKRFVYSF